MRLITSCFAVFVILISGAFSAAQDQAYTEDEVLRYAKSVDVAKLDSTLPSQPLEEWLLRGPARIDELYWRVSLDCDLKDPKPDAGGDLPLCVKVGFRRGNTTGFGLLTVGTRKSGIKGQPALQYLDVVFPFSVGDYDKLSEFPRYLDGIVPTVTVAHTGNCVQTDSSSRPNCPHALAFFRELQSALQANNRHAVAGMIAYPLLATAHHKTVHITSERGLLAHFDEIFDGAVRCVILHATEKDVWGNWQGFTVDGGAVWFDSIIPVTEKADPSASDFWTKYPFKIKTVNNGSEYPCNSSGTPSQ
jgi:hypothetical protein